MMGVLSSALGYSHKERLLIAASCGLATSIPLGIIRSRNICTLVKIFCGISTVGNLNGLSGAM